MNYLDLLISIPLVWGAFNGFRKGLVIEVASLVALVAGIYGALEFSSYVSGWLNEQFDWSENVIKMTSFTLTFITIVILVHLVARLIQKLVKLVALGTINRIFGAIFGTVKFLFIVSAILYVINNIDERYPFIAEDEKNNSMLFNPVSEIIPLLYPKIENEIKEAPHSFIA